MRLKRAMQVLTIICVAETIVGGHLVLRYALADATAAMAVQFVGFIISLAGAAYGGSWLADHRGT